MADVSVAPGAYAKEVLYAYLGIESRSTLGHENAEGREARRHWALLKQSYFDDLYNRR